MYKLIIAEDEINERKAIKSLLNEFYSGKIEIVAETNNGKDAVIIADEKKPDMVLLDIHMPLLSGLEAAKKIKCIAPDTEIVILTAFNYFDYAQESVNIGISDYLLKPVTDEYFFRSIEKMINSIEKRKEEKSSADRIEKKVFELKPFIERDFIQNILLGKKMVPEEILKNKEFMGISEKKLICIIVRFSDKIPEISMINWLKEKLKTSFPSIIGCILLEEIILMAFNDNLKCIIEDNSCNIKLRNIENKLKMNFFVSCKIEAGSICDDIADFYYSYNDAKEKFEDVNNKMNISRKSYPYKQENLICREIIDGDLKGAEREFNIFFNFIIKSEYTLDEIKEQMKQFCIILNRNAIYYLNNSFKLFNISHTLLEIDRLKDNRQINHFIVNILKITHQNITMHKREKTSVLVEDAKRYINENYIKDISLENVAEYLRISQFYLSKMFKKYNEKSFKDYLIETRMEQAKVLLSIKRKSIKETAYQVGYSDPNYFSTAFKKYTGFPAKEYSRLSGFPSCFPID